VRVPLAKLFGAPTVERLAEEVRRGGGETSLLVPIRPGGSRPPLFLVHPGGGNVIAYAPLASRLDAEQPVYGLRSRGIERGEKPNWTVEEMARDYLAAIREVQPSGPYRLGGWSLGGVIAWEMARQLAAAGETVERLVLIDARSPRLEDPDGAMPRDEFRMVRSFAEDLGVPEDLLALPEAEPRDGGEVAYLGEVLTAARAAGLVPKGLDLARMQDLYGIFRINLQAMHEYRPGSTAGASPCCVPASARCSSGSSGAGPSAGRAWRGAGWRCGRPRGTTTACCASRTWRRSRGRWSRRSARGRALPSGPGWSRALRG
jgi:thioesterase domain-containing protein